MTQPFDPLVGDPDSPVQTVYHRDHEGNLEVIGLIDDRRMHVLVGPTIAIAYIRRAGKLTMFMRIQYDDPAEQDETVHQVIEQIAWWLS